MALSCGKEYQRFDSIIVQIHRNSLKFDDKAKVLIRPLSGLIKVCIEMDITES